MKTWNIHPMSPLDDFLKNPHVTYALCPFHPYFEVSRKSDKPKEVRLTYASVPRQVGRMIIFYLGVLTSRCCMFFPGCLLCRCGFPLSDRWHFIGLTLLITRRFHQYEIWAADVHAGLCNPSTPKFLLTSLLQPEQQTWIWRSQRLQYYGQGTYNVFSSIFTPLYIWIRVACMTSSVAASVPCHLLCLPLGD